MAYSNWGARVYRNNERHSNYEDESIIVDGKRIGTYHAVLGGGNILLCGYKNYPVLFHINSESGELEKIDLTPFESCDGLEHKGVIDGYKFSARQYDDNRIDLELEEPCGTIWTSTCGYGYGG